MIDFDKEEERLRDTLNKGIALLQKVKLVKPVLIQAQEKIGSGFVAIHYSPTGSAYVKVKTFADFATLQNNLTPGEWRKIDRVDEVTQFNATLNGIDFNVVVTSPAE